MKVLVDPEVPYRWRVRMFELAGSHLESSFVGVELRSPKAVQALEVCVKQGLWV